MLITVLFNNIAAQKVMPPAGNLQYVALCTRCGLAVGEYHMQVDSRGFVNTALPYSAQNICSIVPKVHIVRLARCMLYAACCRVYAQLATIFVLSNQLMLRCCQC